MLPIIIVLGVVAAIMQLLPVPVDAQVATCENLLVPDKTFIQMDVSTDLAYLSQISASNFQQHKANAQFDGAFPVGDSIIKGSGSYEEFNQKRQQLYQEYQFNYSQKDLSTYYIQRLPAERGEQYLACVNPFGFRARISYVDKDKIGIIVEWRPGPNQPTRVKFEPVTLDGGSWVSTMPTHLNYSAKQTLTFNRLSASDFRFTANIGGDTATLFVPKHLERIIPPQLVTMEAMHTQSGGWVTIANRVTKRTRFSVVGKYYNHYPTSIVTAAYGVQYRIDDKDGKVGSPINNDMLPHWIEPGQSAYVRVSDPVLLDNDSFWEDPNWKTLFKDKPDHGPLRYIVEQ